MQGSVELQKLRIHRFFNAQAIFDNASATSTCLDTAGLDGVYVVVTFGATDIAMTALKVQEADAISSATALTSGTDIPLADFSVSPLTLPSATADNTSVGVYIPVVGARKRYFNITATFGDGTAGTFATAIAICTPKIVPSDATGRGLGQQSLVVG
jgi:hypothetical protein